MHFHLLLISILTILILDLGAKTQDFQYTDRTQPSKRIITTVHHNSKSLSRFYILSNKKNRKKTNQNITMKQFSTISVHYRSSVIFTDYLQILTLTLTHSDGARRLGGGRLLTSSPASFLRTILISTTRSMCDLNG